MMQNDNYTQALNTEIHDLQGRFLTAADIRNAVRAVWATDAADDPSVLAEHIGRLTRLLAGFALPEGGTLLDAVEREFHIGTAPDESEWFDLSKTIYEDILKYCKGRIPEQSDAFLTLLGQILHCTEVFPTPAAYMRRIVDRLEDPADGWQNDTLRLRILKRFLRYGDALRAESATLTGIHWMLARRDHPEISPEIWEYSPDKAVESQRREQRSALAKPYAGIAKKDPQKYLSMLSDDLFVLPAVMEDKATALKGKFGLLVAADELAAGVFKRGGRIKKLLYLFAIVYHMTYRGRGSAPMHIPDAHTDIEKNLFQDYYNNSLLRFLLNENQDAAATESEPFLPGINYKNYTEMILLYYLQRDDLTPAEKLRRSAEMRAALAKDKTEPAEQLSTQAMLHTAEEAFTLPEEQFADVLRRKYLRAGNSNPLDIATGQNTAYRVYAPLREELREKLRAWYAGYLAEKWLSTHELKTRIRGYAELRELHERERAMEQAEAQLRAECRQKAADTPLQSMVSTFCTVYNLIEFAGKNSPEYFDDENLEALRQENTPAELHTFTRLMTWFSSYLQNWDPEIPGTEKDSAKLSRSALVLVQYFLYLLTHEADAENGLMSAQRCWDDFIGTEREPGRISRVLTDAGYPAMCGTNLFDVLIVLSAYGILNP